MTDTNFAGICAAIVLGAMLCVADPAAATTQPTRLTNIINSYPCPSPDGAKIAFQSNRTGRYEIYVMDADGTGIVQLTDREGDNVTPAWSPDGRTIAFASTPGGNSDIYLMNADGSGWRRLTEHPGDDSHPHWSASGDRIIFNSPRSTPDLSVDWLEQWHEIYSIKPDGTDLRKHTEFRAVCTFPSYSPDGTKILYRRIIDTPGFAWDLSGRPRNSEIMLADVDGKNEINLSNNAAFDGWPMWAPDGETIAFASNRAGPANVGQIYLVNPDGTEFRQLTSGAWSHAQPAWSPDGKSILAYELLETADYEFGDVVRIPISPAE